jgi:hypothetical protein
MPTAVYDASLITFRKRAGVLASYYSGLQAASNSGVGTVRTEQPTLQSGEIITTRRQGACICADNNAGTPFNRAGPGPCGCGI